jgi:transcriptional regulator with XRE-family HTH domain
VYDVDQNASNKGFYMKTSEYLDTAKKVNNLRSDNELARMMKWSKSQVNNYRHNRQVMDNDQALQIAEVLDIPVWNVIADMQVQRAERQNNASKKKAWKKLAKLSKEAGTATVTMLLMVALITPIVFTFASDNLYIMRTAKS